MTRTFLQVLALIARRAKTDRGEAGGQTVDVSIVERCVLVLDNKIMKLTSYHSMLNLMEGIIPEYDRKGKVRVPIHSHFISYSRQL